MVTLSPRLLLLAAPLCLTWPVGAQQTPGTPAAPSAAAPAPAAQTINVTAQRPREFSDSPIRGFVAEGTSALGFELELQRAPATISILSADFLGAAGAQRLADALNLLPGVGIGDNGGTPREGIVIRGYQAQPTVNGIPQAVTSRPAFSFINIERVEVLKGISGVEGNVDDFGGTLDMVTKKPQREPAVEISLGAGDYRQWSAAIDATGAVALGGNLQYRLIAQAQQEAVWRPGQPRSNTRTELFPSINWDYAPGSNVLVELSWIRVNDPLDRGGLYIEGAGFPGNFTPRDWSFHQRSDLQRQNFRQIDVTWNHRFNAALALKLNAQSSRNSELSTGFRNGDTEGGFLFADDGITWNGAGVEIPIFPDDGRNRYKSDGVTAELRARFVTADISHTLKLSASASEGSSVYATGGVNVPLGFYPVVDNTVNLFAPRNDQKANLIGVDGPYYPYFRDITERQGIGAQWLAEWTPRFRSVFGWRHETTDKKFGDFGATEAEVGFPPFGQDERDLKSDALRLGTSYDLLDDLSVFATFGAGRFEQAATARDGGRIDSPRQVSNLEAGVKWSLAGGQALATLSAYRLRERNLLTSDCTNSDPDCPFQKLVGGRRIQGLEFDLRGRVAPDVQIGGGLALQDADIIESPSGFTGNRFSNTPRVQASALVAAGWGAFGLPQLSTNLSVVHVADRYGNSGNTITLPAYTLVNLGVGWQFTHDVRLSFNVSNLLDETYYTAMQDNDSAASDQVGVGERRLMRLTLDWRF